MVELPLWQQGEDGEAFAGDATWVRPTEVAAILPGGGERVVPLTLVVLSSGREIRVALAAVVVVERLNRPGA